MKKFIIIILAIFLVIGGGYLLKKDSKSSKSAAGAKPTSHLYGEGKTGVRLIEFGDFQCPGCKFFSPLLNQVKEKYKEEITFQFVNFPLITIHQNAQSAARAAHAASNQNKFWEMHDLLYDNQDGWKNSTNAPKDFEAFAQQLGLDMVRYRKDFASADTNAAINADREKGNKLKLTGTPSIFIDDKQIEETNSISTLEKLSAVIDAAILAKTGKPSKTVASPATQPPPVTTEAPKTTN